MEYGHTRCPSGTWLCVSGGNHRRVLASGVGLAVVEHPGFRLFYIDCLGEALRVHGRAEIFNSDLGVQFTSVAFTRVRREAGIAISMDGRGRALDKVFVERLWRSVKYEDIYLKDYETLAQVQAGLKTYFAFYNSERRHQSLGYQTPDQVYLTGQGGNASIIDKFDRPSALAPPHEDAAPVTPSSLAAEREPLT